MINIEEALLNRFDMTRWETGFVDNFSNMSVSVSRSKLGLMELCPRGLIEWRKPMTEELCMAGISTSNSGSRQYPIYIYKTEFLPWVVRQEGICMDGEGNKLLFHASLLSPETDMLLWKIEISNQGTGEKEYWFHLKGSMLEAEKRHIIQEVDKGPLFVFNPETKVSRYLLFQQLDGIQPIWSIRSEMVDRIEINKFNNSYSMVFRPARLKPGESTAILVQLDYGAVEIMNYSTWTLKKLYSIQDTEPIIKNRKNQWTKLIGNAFQGTGDGIKEIRSAAGLVRCGCKWGLYKGREEVIASYCSISNWSSTAFFWDSIIAALGLGQFNIKLAQDAIKTVFLRQRKDGCVPTHSYAHADGSTFYPQAPITAWAMLRLTGYGLENEFIHDMLPRIDALHQWFISTQDHDGDGLPEWRFTGCPADNSPLYDHYARPINKDLAERWNIYIPPIASVSLNSFLIMDAKCLARLYDKIGNSERCSYYSRHAKELEKKLKTVCFKDGEMFYDYDHHTGHYNQALTLYSFLPLWAGIELDTTIRRNMIEKYLLNSGYFFGEYPFPYLAYNEEAYRADGYWRGRIWPHTVIWILEMLCNYGYEEHADIAAGRLLEMMDKKEEILENYHSSPQLQGGGEIDYNWSFASYLMLENKEYRRNVIAEPIKTSIKY